MDTNEQDFVKQMVNDIRDDLKEHRKETREDINKLREQLQEVKATVDINHNQLIRVETSLTTKEGVKTLSASQLSAWAAIGLCLISTGSLYYKVSNAHEETEQRLQQNHADTKESIQQAVQRAVDDAIREKANRQKP
jgi:ABC-type transporter MlaC component